MRADEPRVTIRLSAVDHAVLAAAAETAGVALGALIREAAMRHARDVAGSAEGLPKMRRASSEVEKSEPIDLSEKIDLLEPDVAFDPRGRRDVYPVPRIPGVKTARDLAMERQAMLNKGRKA